MGWVGVIGSLLAIWINRVKLRGLILSIFEIIGKDRRYTIDVDDSQLLEHF